MKSPDTFGRWEHGTFTAAELERAGAFRTDEDWEVAVMCCHPRDGCGSGCGRIVTPEDLLYREYADDPSPISAARRVGDARRRRRDSGVAEPTYGSCGVALAGPIRVGVDE